MQLSKFICVISSIVLTCFSAQAEKQKIYWGVVHLPPISMTSGPHQGQGLLDKQTDMLINALPDYEHHKISISLPRLIEEFTAGKPFCFPALIRTASREQFVDFGPPITFLLPNGVITRRSDRQQISAFINADGNIDLDDLLSKTSLKLSTMEKRSYSTHIDAILDKHKMSENLLIRAGLPRPELSVRQLLNGRTDGVLGRPVELFYHAHLEKKDRRIEYHPIAEDSEISVTQVGCAKGDWNKKFMKDLASASKRLRSDPEFVKPTLNWLPANFRDRFIQRHNKSLTRIESLARQNFKN